MSHQPEVDNVDLKILSLLMEDANIPYTEIAKKIFVSGGTVHVRMKKMQEMGIVTGAQLKVDHAKLGYDIIAFLGIYLEKSSMYQEVVEKLRQIPEIVFRALHHGHLLALCPDHLPRYQALAHRAARQDPDDLRHQPYRDFHLAGRVGAAGGAAGCELEAFG